MRVQFSCRCGCLLHASYEDVGKIVRCPKCNREVQVPNPQQQTNSKTVVVPPPVQISSIAGSQNVRGNHVSLVLESVSIGHIVIGMFVFWGSLILLTLFASATSILGAAALAILTLAITLFFLVAILKLFLTKMASLKSHDVEYVRLFGFKMLGIASWDPNEGVLFLKDKKIGPVDSNPLDGGGVMFLVPWLGEELALRAPLEIRTTKFEDNNVLTREYVPLTIKGAIYWRIAELESFYLSVSRSIHEVNDRGALRSKHAYDRADAIGTKSSHSEIPCQITAGEEWIRLIAEEQTRSEVFHASTGLLVAGKIVEGLPAEMQSLLATDSYNQATDGLAEGIRKRIEDIGQQYGIMVDRVSLQEVQLDSKIREAAIAACVSAYSPLIAQRKSTAEKLHMEANTYGQKRMLEGEVEVIGKDAVAKREVLGSIQPFAFGNPLIEVLEKFFGENIAKENIAGPGHKKQIPNATARKAVEN